MDNVTKLSADWSQPIDQMTKFDNTAQKLTEHIADLSKAASRASSDLASNSIAITKMEEAYKLLESGVNRAAKSLQTSMSSAIKSLKKESSDVAESQIADIRRVHAERIREIREIDTLSHRLSNAPSFTPTSSPIIAAQLKALRNAAVEAGKGLDAQTRKNVQDQLGTVSSSKMATWSEPKLNYAKAYQEQVQFERQLLDLRLSNIEQERNARLATSRAASDIQLREFDAWVKQGEELAAKKLKAEQTRIEYSRREYDTQLKEQEELAAKKLKAEQTRIEYSRREYDTQLKEQEELAAKKLKAEQTRIEYSRREYDTKVKEQEELEAKKLKAEQTRKEYSRREHDTFLREQEEGKVKGEINSLRQHLAPDAKTSDQKLALENALHSLQTQMLSTGNVTGGTVAAYESLKKGTLQVTESNYQFASALRTVQQAMNTRAANSMQMTLEKLERFVSYRLVAQTFYTFSAALRTNVTDAMAFGKAISEIQTINQNDPLLPKSVDLESLHINLVKVTDDYEIWKTKLIELSDKFNIPVLEMAEGSYMAISNQVAKGTEALRFMADASNLAKAAVSSQANSVNALSSVLKAFQVDVINSDVEAAKLFKGVELGRYRLDDIANTIGRVDVVAAQLHLTTTEFNSSLALITRMGVPASEAMTQLRNIFDKLIKPGEKMKELFKSWGVDSGEAAIQTFSWIGVLERLAKEAAKGSSELGELFPRIRGYMGLATLTQNIEDYKKDMASVEDSYDYYLRAIETRMTNHTTILGQEQMKFKNTLMSEADSLLKFLASIQQGTKNVPGLNVLGMGDIASLTTEFTVATVGLTGLAHAGSFFGKTIWSAGKHWLDFMGNLDRGTAAMSTMGRRTLEGTRFLYGMLPVIGLATYAWHLYNTVQDARIRNASKSYADKTDEDFTKFSEKANKATTEFNKSFEGITEGSLGEIARARAALTTQTDMLSEGLVRMGKAIKTNNTATLTDLESDAKEFEKRAKEIGKIQAEAFSGAVERSLEHAPKSKKFATYYQAAQELSMMAEQAMSMGNEEDAKNYNKEALDQLNKAYQVKKRNVQLEQEYNSLTQQAVRIAAGQFGSLEDQQKAIAGITEAKRNQLNFDTLQMQISKQEQKLIETKWKDLIKVSKDAKATPEHWKEVLQSVQPYVDRIAQAQFALFDPKSGITYMTTVQSAVDMMTASVERRYLLERLSTEQVQLQVNLREASQRKEEIDKKRKAYADEIGKDFESTIAQAARSNEKFGTQTWRNMVLGTKEFSESEVNAAQSAISKLKTSAIPLSDKFKEQYYSSDKNASIAALTALKNELEPIFTPKGDVRIGSRLMSPETFNLLDRTYSSINKRLEELGDSSSAVSREFTDYEKHLKVITAAETFNKQYEELSKKANYAKQAQDWQAGKPPDFAMDDTNVALSNAFQLGIQSFNNNPVAQFMASLEGMTKEQKEMQMDWYRQNNPEQFNKMQLPADQFGVQDYNPTIATEMNRYGAQTADSSAQTAENTAAIARMMQPYQYEPYNDQPKTDQNPEGFSSGGKGPRGSDIVPAWLSPGEFIMSANSAKHIGYDKLDHMNRFPQYYAEGGGVDMSDITLQQALELLLRKQRRQESLLKFKTNNFLLEEGSLAETKTNKWLEHQRKRRQDYELKYNSDYAPEGIQTDPRNQFLKWHSQSETQHRSIEISNKIRRMVHDQNKYGTSNSYQEIVPAENNDSEVILTEEQLQRKKELKKQLQLAQKEGFALNTKTISMWDPSLIKSKIIPRGKEEIEQNANIASKVIDVATVAAAIGAALIPGGQAAAPAGLSAMARLSGKGIMTYGAKKLTGKLISTGAEVAEKQVTKAMLGPMGKKIAAILGGTATVGLTGLYGYSQMKSDQAADKQAQTDYANKNIEEGKERVDKTAKDSNLLDNMGQMAVDYQAQQELQFDVAGYNNAVARRRKLKRQGYTNEDIVALDQQLTPQSNKSNPYWNTQGEFQGGKYNFDIEERRRLKRRQPQMGYVYAGATGGLQWNQGGVDWWGARQFGQGGSVYSMPTRQGGPDSNQTINNTFNNDIQIPASNNPTLTAIAVYDMMETQRRRRVLPAI